MSSGASTGCELLTNEDMRQADARAVAAGIPYLVLMESAGRAVADAASEMAPMGGRIAVLCGPGNNGGDGFVAARLLQARGFGVGVYLLGELSRLKGDAGEMAARWGGEVRALESFSGSCDLIVDALFGAGLSRPLDGVAAQVIDVVNRVQAPILAVDVPSGLDGDTGAVRGSIAIQATRTVTFFRRKIGHLLMPGRVLCGDVVVADIGIPASVLGDTDGRAPTLTTSNDPTLWRAAFPTPGRVSHKYTRGHAVVVSGPPISTGAARLGARGALRAGAGLVTVASPRAAFPVNAAHLTAIMLLPFEVPSGLAKILADRRKNAVLIGPGCGVGQATREMVEIALKSGAGVVLDADALTSFDGRGDEADDDERPETASKFGFLPPAKTETTASPEQLFNAIMADPKRPVVLTPHEGEFKRLFGSMEPGLSKLERARRASVTSSAVIILKGPDTVIASPDGRAAINENAPPWLATAGSGDVLAGFVTGLMAQGTPAFEAACAAVWLHGECANLFGPGLIAEDIPEVLPKVLARLYAQSG